MGTIRVAIYEDDDNYREAFSFIIKGTPRLELAGAWSSCDKVAKQVAHHAPDVILMDLRFIGHDRQGVEAIRLAKRSSPEANVLVLTNYGDDDEVFQSICAGASGYLLKGDPPARIIESIFEVAEGGAPMSATIARKVLRLFEKFPPQKPGRYGLSGREVEVLEKLGDGLTQKVIAGRLFISQHTVSDHIRKTYVKLHVNTAHGAVAKAIREGII